MKELVVSLLVAVSAAILLQLSPTSAGYYPPRSDCGYNRSHNFFYGTKTHRLLYSNRTIRGYEYSPYRKTIVDVDFPPKGQHPTHIIYYIEVLDHYRDGRGACAQITRGGIDHFNVTVRLTSSLNHPIDSTINVYGSYYY